MTFRDLLLNTDKEKVFNDLFSINTKNYDFLSLEEIKEGYSRVIKELLECPVEETKNKDYKIYLCSLLGYEPDDGDSGFVDVSLLNLHYIEPPEGYKPWGGNGNNQFDAPEGHYNLNWSNYNKCFGFGFLKWSEALSLEVVIDEEVKQTINNNEIMLAYILWEFTWYGMTEGDQKLKMKEIEDACKECDNI